MTLEELYQTRRFPVRMLAHPLYLLPGLADYRRSLPRLVAWGYDGHFALLTLGAMVDVYEKFAEAEAAGVARLGGEVFLSLPVNRKSAGLCWVEQEWVAYDAHLDHWLSEGRQGSFAALRGQSLIGFYTEVNEAIRAAEVSGPPGPFLVEKVQPRPTYLRHREAA